MSENVLFVESTGNSKTRLRIYKLLADQGYNAEFHKTPEEAIARVAEMKSGGRPGDGLVPPVAVVFDGESKNWGKLAKQHLLEEPPIPVVVFNAGQMAGPERVETLRMDNNHISFVSGPLEFIPDAIGRVIDLGFLHRIKGGSTPARVAPAVPAAPAQPTILYADDQPDLHELPTSALTHCNVVTDDKNNEPITSVGALIEQVKHMIDTGQPISQIMVDNKMFLGKGDKEPTANAGLAAIQELRAMQKSGELSDKIPIALLSSETDEPQVVSAIAKMNEDTSLPAVSSINKQAAGYMQRLHDAVEYMAALGKPPGNTPINGEVELIPNHVQR